MMLMERKFTWVLKEFSSSQDKIRFSPPFKLVGCNWRLVAYPKGVRNDNRYLSLYLDLDPGSLTPGWCRDVEFSITLVNNGWRRWNKVWEEKCCYNAEDNSWGFNQYLSLFKLHRANEEFVVDDTLIIIAKVRVLPEESVKIISEERDLFHDVYVGKSLAESFCQVVEKIEDVCNENLDDGDVSEEGLDDNDATDKGLDDDDKSEEGSYDDDVSVNKSQGDSSCQVEQKTENVSKENLENDEASEESSDDDEASEESSDDDEAPEESSDDDDASEEGSANDNDYASVNKSQEDSSCQVEQKTENVSKEILEDDDASEEGSDDDESFEESSDGDDDASEESSDDDDDASEESSDDDDASEESLADDDASSPISDDGGREKCPLNQSIPLKSRSLTLENPVMRRNSVASEIEVSNVDSGNAPREDPNDDDAFEDDQVDDDDASSLVSSVSDKDVSSLKKLKSMEEASQKVENGDTGCNNAASVTEASSNLLNEIQPVKETMDVHGFQVFSSEVELVSQIFKRHPDIALGFRPKNQYIRRAFMNQLCSLIETLCQSPEKLSEDDLRNADDTLVDLIDAGFKLDWLKTKLNEVSEKKASVARIQTMEEELQKLRLMFVDLESQLQKEKAEYLAARAPLSYKDVIC